jgi:hypothetical protein
MMVRVGVNEFDCFGIVVTRAAFSYNKLDVFIINDSFVDLSYVVYIIPPMASSKAQSRIRTSSLSSLENPSLSPRSKIPLTSDGVMLVLNMS